MQKDTSSSTPQTLEDVLAVNMKLAEENAVLSEKAEGLKETIADLRHQLDKLRRMIFDATSEKLRKLDLQKNIDIDAAQLNLFNEGVDNAIPAVAIKEKISYERIKPKKDGHGRRVLPDDIRRNEIVLDIPEEEKTCDCGCTKNRIGEETSEELDFVPAHLIVNKTIRPKYACPHCPEKGVASAPPPSKIIPKSLGTPALYAHILVSKFRWHLPLYRQEKMFDHYGVPINRSVMCEWEKQLLPYLELIYDELKMQLLASHYVQADETTLPVLDKTKQGKAHKGYLWPYTNGDSIAFEYQSGRSHAGPLAFLKGFKGYLQSDGYAAYETVAKACPNDITHFVCWAHARRELFDVVKHDPEYIRPLLELIGRLYVLERRMRRIELPPEKIVRLRKRIAPRYLDAIKQRLDTCSSSHTPKSVVRQAVNYLLNRWSKLCVYLDDGILQIDNNRIENAIRPVALGRKNWLFAGSEDGAKKIAVVYSIINSCVMNNIDPEMYLKDLFSRIHDHPANRIAELTPVLNALLFATLAVQLVSTLIVRSWVTDPTTFPSPLTAIELSALTKL